MFLSSLTQRPLYFTSPYVSEGQLMHIDGLRIFPDLINSKGNYAWKHLRVNNTVEKKFSLGSLTYFKNNINFRLKWKPSISEMPWCHRENFKSFFFSDNTEEEVGFKKVCQRKPHISKLHCLNQNISKLGNQIIMKIVSYWIYQYQVEIMEILKVCLKVPE